MALIIFLVVLGVVVVILANNLSKREAAIAAEYQNIADEQEGYRIQMEDLGKSTSDLIKSMPSHITVAESWLDRAEAEYCDGAFAPFWDSVEKAAYTLAWIDKDIRQTKNNSVQYIELINKYEDDPPEYPLDRATISKLGEGTAATAERMKTIVRKGQCNFQFATIFEQRKTNQILIAGFTNLAQALDQMSNQISSSITELRHSIEDLVPAMEAIHDQLASDSEMHRKHHTDIEEKLDNIQRRRKPIPKQMRDGEY